MLNQMLRRQLSAGKSGHSSQASPVVDHDSDAYETASAYRRWAPGVRTLLRLRYLNIKSHVLERQRRLLKYDATSSEIKHSIVKELVAAGSSGRLWTWIWKPFFFYTLLLIGLLFTGAGIFYVWQTRSEMLVFKDALPRYSDAVYVWKAERERDPESTLLPQLAATVERQRAEILEFHRGQSAISTPLASLLDAVRTDATTARDMPTVVKAVNDALYEYELGFYISAVSEAVPCSWLPRERFMERLFGGGEPSPELCRIHGLLTFNVEEARYYLDNDNRHLTLFTRRLDELAIDEAVLGRVHIGDNTAQVLLGNIAGASAASLTAISNGSLQSKLMPQGMTDVYGLESLARRLQSNVIAGYVTEIERHWTNRIRTVWLELTGQHSSPLASAAQKLEERLADVTAFHEVQHLVDQSMPLPEPEWLQASLAVFGERILNDDFRKHVLWELSAFFTHLSNGKELQGVLLNEFTAITLNPMLQDQPHFYSVRLLLPILHQMAQEGRVTPPVPATTLADVARYYKVLAGRSEDLGELARTAYPQLFGVELPQLESVPEAVGPVVAVKKWLRRLSRSVHTLVRRQRQRG